MKIQFLLFIFAFSLIILFINTYTLTINASTNNETNWTAYESSQYGISFEYPSQFVPTELEGENPLLTVLLSNPTVSDSPDYDFISFSVYHSNMTLENFVNEELTNYVAEEGMVVGEVQHIMISQNTPGLTFDSSVSVSDSSLTKNIVFKANNYLYTLSYTGSKDQFRFNVYDHIINTIKISSIAS